MLDDTWSIQGPHFLNCNSDAVDLSAPFHLGAALLLAAAWRCDANAVFARLRHRFAALGTGTGYAHAEGFDHVVLPG
jgi:hypothetical protein